MPANLEVFYDLNEVNGDISLKLYKSTDEPAIGQLNLINVNAIAGDRYMMVNTQTQLIEGLDASKNKTGNLYNKYIDTGDFFWPPVGRSILVSDKPFVSARYTPLFY